jgi:hypothetical protein
MLSQVLWCIISKPQTMVKQNLPVLSVNLRSSNFPTLYVHILVIVLPLGSFLPPRLPFGPSKMCMVLHPDILLLPYTLWVLLCKLWSCNGHWVVHCNVELCITWIWSVIGHPPSCRRKKTDQDKDTQREKNLKIAGLQYNYDVHL